MAYSALPAKVASDTLTLGNYNAIKGNFEAGVPDIFTTKGDLAAATGANAASRVAVGTDDAFLVADSSQSAGIAWQNAPACRVYNDADIDPATSSWVALTFNSETYDTNSMHSTSSNTGRLTAPTGGGGIYIIGGCVRFDSSGQGSGSNNYGLQVRVNGATVIAQVFQSLNHNSIDLDVTISTAYQLSATDYVELLVYTVVDVDILAVTDNSPTFWASWVRRL